MKTRQRVGRKMTPVESLIPKNVSRANVLSPEQLVAQEVPDYESLKKTLLALKSPETFFNDRSLSGFQKGAIMAAFYKWCHAQGFRAYDSTVLSASHLYILKSIIDAASDEAKPGMFLKDSVFSPFLESLLYTIYVLKEWHPDLSTRLIHLHMVHVFEALSRCTVSSVNPVVANLFPYDVNAWHVLMKEKPAFADSLLETLFCRDLPRVHCYLHLKQGEEAGRIKPYLLTLCDQLLMSVSRGDLGCQSFLLDIFFHSLARSQALTFFLINSLANSLTHFNNPKIPIESKLHLLSVSFMLLEHSVELTGKVRFPFYMWASFAFPQTLRVSIISVTLASLVGAIKILRDPSIRIRSSVPEVNGTKLPLAIQYQRCLLKKSRSLSVYYNALYAKASSYQQRLSELTSEDWPGLNSFIKRLFKESEDLRLRLLGSTQSDSKRHAERMIIFLLNPTRINDREAYTSPDFSSFSLLEKEAFYSQLASLIISKGDAFFKRDYPLFLALTRSTWLPVRDFVRYLFISNHESLAVRFTTFCSKGHTRKAYLSYYYQSWRSRLYVPPSKDALPRLYDAVPAWIDDITQRLYRLVCVFKDAPPDTAAIILASLWAILDRFKADTDTLYMSLTNPAVLSSSIQNNSLLKKATPNVWSQRELQPRLLRVASFMANASYVWLSHPSLCANTRLLLCYALAAWGGEGETLCSSPIESLSALMSKAVSIRPAQGHSP